MVFKENRLYWAAMAAVFLWAFFLRAGLAVPRQLGADSDEAQYLRLGSAIASDGRMYDTYPENISAERGCSSPFSWRRRAG
jgi:hypothetical protein